MTSVQIKNVPRETHAVLRRRAAAAHQSLQEYLLKKLIDEASRPTMQEIFDEVAARGDLVELDVEALTAMIRADRESR
jgi:plasmid stability protein